MAKAFELPARAMAIFAHPDDAEFGCSGTIALWASLGVHVTYCLLTSGNKGTHDPDLSPDRLARTREREQRAAGKVLGVKEFVFLRHDDGELEVSMDLRAEVCRAIRECRPDLVLTQDPWRPYQVHPDHRVAGWSAMDGVIAARDHLFFPEHPPRVRDRRFERDKLPLLVDQLIIALGPFEDLRRESSRLTAAVLLNVGNLGIRPPMAAQALERLLERHCLRA